MAVINSAGFGGVYVRSDGIPQDADTQIVVSAESTEDMAHVVFRVECYSQGVPHLATIWYYPERGALLGDELFNKEIAHLKWTLLQGLEEPLEYRGHVSSDDALIVTGCGHWLGEAISASPRRRGRGKSLAITYQRSLSPISLGSSEDSLPQKSTPTPFPW